MKERFLSVPTMFAEGWKVFMEQFFFAQKTTKDGKPHCGVLVNCVW